MIGKKFTQLQVIEFSHSDKWYKKYYKCRCDCGNERIANGSKLQQNRIRRCIDCKNKLYIKHGKSGRPYKKIYGTWESMKGRCLNPNNYSFKLYGALNIKTCDEWLTFQNFYNDMGEQPENTKLDRFDKSLDYYKENCFWREVIKAK